jgi:hypothetical protein
MSNQDDRQNFWSEASRGKIKGYTRYTVFGNNDDVDSATVPETIWEAGGLVTWLSAADNLEVFSSNANDTSLAGGGTGMRTLLIQGLDANYNEISEIVSLEGTGVVTTTNQFLRVNKAVGLSAGTGAINEGAITIRDATGDNTVEYIGAGQGISHSAKFTVPLGKDFIIKSIVLGAGKTQSILVRIELRVKSNGATIWTYTNHADLSTDSDPTSINLDHVPINLVEKTDLELLVSTSSGNNAEVTAVLHGFLVGK